jgi:hypothetical protein
VILTEYRDHSEAYEPQERRFLLYEGEGISFKSTARRQPTA